MIIYKYLESRGAFQVLVEGRLKLSEINKVNDVFELEQYSFKNDQERDAFLKWKNNRNDALVFL